MTDLLMYAQRLRTAFCRATSELEDLWSPDNPSTGQCHTTAFLIQQAFGGRILEGTFDDATVHFWNDIGGMSFDATRDQFPLEGTLRTVRVADPPLAITVDKALLLARLAGVELAA